MSNLRKIAIILIHKSFRILMHAAILLFGHNSFSQSLQFANLGKCELVNGQIINDCRLGYRTFGTVRNNNIILVPTWLAGKSEDWVTLLGSNKLIDTTEYFVIITDALANGVSSSPSNISERFPAITIEDMVRLQHKMLRDVIKIPHLKAVVGISMGGIQTFEWALAHPDYADRFVSIVGTQRAPRWERAWLGTVVRIIETGEIYRIPDQIVWNLLAGILTMTNGTQESVNSTSPDLADKLLNEEAISYGKNINLANLAVQTRAILNYNAENRTLPGSQIDSQHFKGRFLVINSGDDRAVSADPAFEYADRIGAEKLSVKSVCGHWVFACETAIIGKAIADFLHK